MINHFAAKRSSAPDEYKKSQISIDIVREDGRWTRMLRCGITPPHYPEFATYYEYFPDLEIRDVYVYEGGYFWISPEWRSYYKENAVTPFQDMQKGGDK